MSCTPGLTGEHPGHDENGTSFQANGDYSNHGIVYACVMVGMGLVGAFLNILVIVGVYGNARLGTTVNKLLIWVCCFSLLEATVGILMKALILAQVVQNVVLEKHNRTFCQVILAIPFIFSNCIIVLWTAISVYRLYLVITSATRGGKNRLVQSSRVSSLAQRVLPLVACTAGTLTGILMSFWAKPFVIFRECRGSCDDFDEERDDWAPLFLVIVALLYHIPSGLCYGIIYCFIKKHQVNQTQRSSFTQPGNMAMSLLQVPQNNRPPLASVSPDEPESSNMIPEASVGNSEITRLGLASEQSRKSSVMERLSLRLTNSRAENASGDESDDVFDEQEFTHMKHSNIFPLREVKHEEPIEAIAQPPGSHPRAKSLIVPSIGSNGSSRLSSVSSPMIKLPKKIVEIRTDLTSAEVGSSWLNTQSKIRRRRRRRKNIISAKLSAMFLFISVLTLVVVHFGYDNVPEKYKDRLNDRSFANAFFYDICLLVVGPLMLLYGSKELRTSIKKKLTSQSH